MKARSPENGFDEIRDLFKDDESTVLEDLDLSYFINKDLGPGYLFDELTGYDTYNIQFNEQGQPELPSLPLSFGDYDIPGPSTDDLNSTAESGFHLPDSDVIQDQNLPSEPKKDNNQDNNEQLCSHYIGTSSGFQVEVESLDLDHGVQNVAHAQLVDGIRSPPPDEIVDETCFEAIQEKMNDFELCFKEENINEASISHVPEVFLHSSSHQVDLESEVRLIDDSNNLQPKCVDIDENHSKETSGRKRKREVAGSSCAGETEFKKSTNSSDSQHHKSDLDGCSDQDRGLTSNSSWPQKLHQNIQESSCSKQSRDKYTHPSPKRVGRTVSPPSNRRQDRYNEHRRERNRSRSRSPCGRDYHRMRYSPRKRYPSRSRRRSPRTRNSPPAFFRGTGLGKPGSCLFVAGLCFSLSERELARKFSRFGRVRDVRIIRDKRSGRSRGYGFLSLEKSEEADAAIRAIHRTEWNGRMILVEKSIPK